MRCVLVIEITLWRNVMTHTSLTIQHKLGRAREAHRLCLGSSIAILLICGRLHAQPELPDFSAATFSDSLQIDNPYWPLMPGTTLAYEGVSTDPDTGETETERMRRVLALCWSSISILAESRSGELSLLRWFRNLTEYLPC